MIREYFKERDRKARHAAIRSVHTDGLHLPARFNPFHVAH